MQNTKSSNFSFNVKSWSISLKFLKPNPLNGYYMQQATVRWQSKKFRGHVASRAGTTTALINVARESL